MGIGKAGRMRASHADREQAIEVLKGAFVQGRLDKHEFDARVGRVFTSRTYLELAAVTADIPPGPIPSRPLPAERLSAQSPASRGVRSGLTMMAVGTALAACVWAVALTTENATALVLALAITVAYAGTLVLASAVLLESRLRKDTTAKPLSPPPLGQAGIR
jgi:Domain of unknown function (DUF1707)